ncbi:UNVERIFIED_CONTAM: hypothetical protein GTU68_065923 [Idotea baltica]|nr:hypothetical protein [Idotea baltica]
MPTFEEFNLQKHLKHAIADLGFERPTPIQLASFSVIRSGKDIVGIAQTGTGKTLAYTLPILQDLKFSKDNHTRVLVLVPTRELVLQVVEQIQQCTTYMTVRTVGIYGGTNINTQKQEVAMGTDIIVATPGRLRDIALTEFGSEMAIIHSNKSQNYRIRSIEQFDQGNKRILLATDVMARGLDLDRISHVINFDTPAYPENYMHRIGRTGRAKEPGTAILFHTNSEQAFKESIEELMDYQIPTIDFPEEVEVSLQLTPDEKPRHKEINTGGNDSRAGLKSGFHEKKDKNKKTNLGGKYRREIAKKYKKPKTRGDKIRNKRKKKN